MVVKINKDDKVYVDDKEYQISEMTTEFLNKLFASLLRKESEIQFEDESKVGYLGSLFFKMREETKEGSPFYNEYLALKKEFDDLSKDNKETEKQDSGN